MRTRGKKTANKMVGRGTGEGSGMTRIGVEPLGIALGRRGWSGLPSEMPQGVQRWRIITLRKYKKKARTGMRG
jgi:hypothetical protein